MWRGRELAASAAASTRVARRELPRTVPSATSFHARVAACGSQRNELSRGSCRRRHQRDELSRGSCRRRQPARRAFTRELPQATASATSFHAGVAAGGAKRDELSRGSCRRRRPARRAAHKKSLCSPGKLPAAEAFLMFSRRLQRRRAKRYPPFVRRRSIAPGRSRLCGAALRLFLPLRCGRPS
ncbi:hypothetical protein SAMN05518855_102533 [Paenibacillus sp. CF384]|nr:hypothetical protein SAMN05518855_102533 [Paenibacillus sp. CF384]